MSYISLLATIYITNLFNTHPELIQDILLIDRQSILFQLKPGLKRTMESLKRFFPTYSVVK